MTYYIIFLIVWHHAERFICHCSSNQWTIFCVHHLNVLSVKLPRCTHFKGYFGRTTRSLHCSSPALGRYLYIRKLIPGVLTLCEVKVYAVLRGKDFWDVFKFWVIKTEFHCLLMDIIAELLSLTEKEVFIYCHSVDGTRHDKGL